MGSADAWLNDLEQFSSDFLQERDQPMTLDRRDPPEVRSL